jgi:pilus assembly protein Flp/PilA
MCKEPEMKFVARFMRDESGATAIEYGLIAALISVGIIAAATTLGNGLGDLFNGIGGKLQSAADSDALGDGEEAE